MTLRHENSIAICVLGMHRSGTSSIARGVNLLGVSLGREDFLVPASQENPEGYWEHGRIVELHEQLMSLLEVTWDSRAPLPPDWLAEPYVEECQTTLRNLVVEYFGQDAIWGWKDPRTCLLLPMWRPVLRDLGVELRNVIVVRNPLDVAQSLTKRNGFSLGHSLALWQLYTLSALLHSHGTRRVMVSYDKYLEEPTVTMDRVASALEIPPPTDKESVYKTLTSFLRKDLRHSKSALRDLKELVGVPDSVEETYNLCLLAEEEPTIMSTEAFHERVTQLYSEYVKYANIFTGREVSCTRMQVYWPLGGAFHESQSDAITVVTDGTVHEYDFPVPSGVSGSIRIDPMDTLAIVSIKEIALVQASNQSGCDGDKVIKRWNSDTKFEGLHLVANAFETTMRDSFCIASINHDAHFFLDVSSIEIPELCHLRITLGAIENSSLALDWLQMNSSEIERIMQHYEWELDNARAQQESQSKIMRSALEKADEKYQEVVTLLGVRQAEILEKDEQLKGMKSQLEQTQEHIALLENEVRAWAALAKEREIEAKEKEIEAREQSEAMRREVELTRSMLRDSQRQLSNIVNTRGYRILRRYYVARGQSVRGAKAVVSLVKALFVIFLIAIHRPRLTTASNARKALYYLKRGGLGAFLYRIRNKLERGIPENEVSDLLPVAEAIDPNKPALLLITHSMGGGANKYLRDYIQKLDGGQNVYKMYIEGRRIVVTHLNAPRSKPLTFRTEDVNDSVFQEIVQDLNIGSIVVNQLVSFPAMDFTNMIQRVNVDYIYIVHDYFSACPSYHLINFAGEYCGGETNQTVCGACIKGGLITEPWLGIRAASIDIVEWRDSFRRFLEGAKRVYAPSEAAKRIINSYYPEVRIEIQEHAVSGAIRNSFDSSFVADTNLKVAFLGTLGHAKGSRVVYQLTELIERSGAPISVKVIGVTDKHQDYYCSGSGVLEVLGAYNSENVSCLLAEHRIGVVIIPSLSPETYSYTAEEALRSGYPVVTFPYGAQAERVKRYDGGWIAEQPNTEDLYKLLRHLERSRDDILRKAENLRVVFDVHSSPNTVPPGA